MRLISFAAIVVCFAMLLVNWPAQGSSVACHREKAAKSCSSCAGVRKHKHKRHCAASSCAASKGFAAAVTCSSSQAAKTEAAAEAAVCPTCPKDDKVETKLTAPAFPGK